MSEWQLFVTGIAPEHTPALIAALLLPALVLAYRHLSEGTRAAGEILRGDPAAPVSPSFATAGLAGARSSGSPVGLSFATAGLAGARSSRSPVGRILAVDDRVAAWLLGVSSMVHLAVPLGHHDEAWLTVAFLVDGVAFGWLALRAAAGRRWRLGGTLLVPATLVAYLVVLGTGGEEPDQVGIATAMLELTILGLCLVPRSTAARRRRVRQVVGGIGLVLFTVVFGAITWGVSFAAHADPVAGHADPTAGHVDHAAHEGHAAHAARAQAGVLMMPVADTPTPAEQRAAADLAARTRAALQRYADIHAALAAGFRPTLARTGFSVHLENKAYGSDGRVLDPDRPEILMYAIADGRATLLSAVFTMPRAGQPGPAPGGPLTRWHAHNGCLSLVPPGFSVVDAYGGCPAFSVQLTLPVMMHVWVVDNPGGPYADHVPDTWTRAFNNTYGVAFGW